MNASTAAPKTMPSVTTIAAQPELSPRASPWAMPGSSNENTVAASMPTVTTLLAQPELSPRASPWAMPGSSKENTVAARMAPAAELSSISRARIDNSLIVQIIQAPRNVPPLANRLARLPATIMLLSYSIMVLQQKYKYGLNGLRVAG